MNYVVAIGSPFNGVELHGPFDDFYTALDWAEDKAWGIEDTHWEIVPVRSAVKEDSADA